MSVKRKLNENIVVVTAKGFATVDGITTQGVTVQTVNVDTGEMRMKTFSNEEIVLKCFTKKMLEGLL